MRVAAIYDIHANLPAVEAVVEDIRQAAWVDESSIELANSLAIVIGERAVA